jgi:hypothetical protein
MGECLVDLLYLVIEKHHKFVFTTNINIKSSGMISVRKWL